MPSIILYTIDKYDIVLQEFHFVFLYTIILFLYAKCFVKIELITANHDI